MSAETDGGIDFPSQRVVDRRAGARMLHSAVPAAIVGVIGGLVLYALESKCLTFGPLSCIQVALIEFLWDTIDIVIVIALVAIGSFLFLRSSGPGGRGNQSNRSK